MYGRQIRSLKEESLQIVKKKLQIFCIYHDLDIKCMGIRLGPLRN